MHRPMIIPASQRQLDIIFFVIYFQWNKELVDVEMWVGDGVGQKAILNPLVAGF